MLPLCAGPLMAGPCPWLLCCLPAAAIEEEESGWKYVHGDVFRFPPNKSLFCAFVGTGTQIFFLALFIFALALVGVFYPYNRGALFSALIVLYALTACIAGYTATSYYVQMEGQAWVRNIMMTCFIYCGPFFAMFMFLNTVAIAYRVGASREGYGTSVYSDMPCEKGSVGLAGCCCQPAPRQPCHVMWQLKSSTMTWPL